MNDPGEANNSSAADESEQLNIWLAGFLVLIAIAHLGLNLLVVLPSLWQNAFHFASFALAFALTRQSVAMSRSLGSRVAVLAIGLMAAAGAVVLVMREQSLYQQGLVFSWIEWLAAACVVIGALELTRRATGIFIPALILIALTYVVVWGAWIPGVFRFPGLSLETLLFRSIYGDDGLFGSIATISSSFVFMFILFGAFLLRSGGGQFVIDIAQALSGRFIGSGGIVAVIASGLMGSISGSAVANTASTGVITIPLMKQSGFSPKFAAGVESAASTGGQLMPPIMGAGAFIMAGYTQLSYLHIVSIALLPALLYFASVIFFVRSEALRNDVRTDNESTIELGAVIKAGGVPFFAPLLVLIGALIAGLTPAYAAGWAILAVVIASRFGAAPMGWRDVLDAMSGGVKAMMVTAILLCSVGLVVNVIAMTGVGNTLSLMITGWAGGNLLIAIGLVAIASLVLGAGLPVTAAYVVLATLCAPAISTLITNQHLVELLVNGNLPVETVTLLLAADPDLMPSISQGMQPDVARALVADLPLNVLVHLRDQLLPMDLIQLSLLSAHMIIFWLSQDSNVTPPVCLTAFTAAAIAGTKPMATGFAAWRLAKGLYLIPLLFAYTPILSGNWAQAIPVFVFALAGLYFLVGALQGYCLSLLNPWQRILIGLVGASLFAPLGLQVQILSLAIGGLLIGLFRYWNRRGAS